MVTHEELEPDSAMRNGITFGWPVVRSNLTSLLETGNALPDLERSFKPGL